MTMSRTIRYASVLARNARKELAEGNRSMANTFLDMMEGVIGHLEMLDRPKEADKVRAIKVVVRREWREAVSA